MPYIAILLIIVSLYSTYTKGRRLVKSVVTRLKIVQLKETFKTHIMVDGETIGKLRQDINAAMEELRLLRHSVSELQKKTKMIEGLDGDKIQSLIQLLTQQGKNM